MEHHVLYSREGPAGVRQVDVQGLVATAFTHRDSRAGDPDLHTHVAVANKVRTRSGKWLSIDGRLMFKAVVAASETYNTAIEKHLTDRLGVAFAERPNPDARKCPVREIVGVDPALNEAWSSRRASITARTGVLASQFQAVARAAADTGGGHPAGAAGDVGDPRRQARTAHPGRAAGHVGRPGPRRSSGRSGR